MKGVDCLLGIMKGRFVILQHGFRLKTFTDCDKKWLTCCNLHNILLNIDGVDNNWESSARSDWEMFHSDDRRKSKFDFVC